MSYADGAAFVRDRYHTSFWHKLRMADLPTPPSGWNWQTVLAAVGSLTIAIGYVVTTQANLANNTSALHDFKVEVSEQLSRMRGDIANLPNVQAELNQIGKRADSMDVRQTSMALRVEDVSRNMERLTDKQEDSKAAFDNIFSRLHALEMNHNNTIGKP